MKITNNISGNNTLNDLIGDITFSELTINNNDIKNNMIESVDNGKLNYTSDVNFNNRNVSNINNIIVGSKMAINSTIEDVIDNARLNVTGRVQIKSISANDSAVIQMQQFNDTDPLGFLFYGEGNTFRIRNAKEGNQDFLFSKEGLLTVPSITTPSLSATTSVSFPNNSVTNAMINNLDVAKINFNGNIDIGNHTLTVGNNLTLDGNGQRNLSLVNSETTGFVVINMTVGEGTTFQMGSKKNGAIDTYFFGRAELSSEDLTVDKFGNVGVKELLTTKSLTVSTNLTLPNNSVTSAMINNLNVSKVNFNSDIDVNSRNITTTGSIEGKYFKGKSLVFSTAINESRLIEFYNHIIINASACKLGFRQIDINISHSGFCILTNNHTATSTITIDVSALTINRDIKLYKNNDPVVEVDKTVALIVDFTINKESITTLTYQVLTNTVVLYVKT